MTQLAKASAVGIISFLAIVGFSTPATTYAWIDFDYTSYINYSVPQSFNYANYPNYGGGYGGFASLMNYAPAKPREQLVVYAFGPTSGGPGGSSMYQSYAPHTYTAPYNQPQYDSYSYQQDYGYQTTQTGGGYPQSTGNQDFWGNDLCNWGSDYLGYPCARDPHQWIYDPYTSSWY